MYTSSNDVAGVTIGVQREVWPDLSPEWAGLVAPPVVVTARPVERPVNARRRAQLSRSRGNMPVRGYRRAAG
ncbi:hypothetical protein BJY16_002852 [Actinoplanes octamycinicus]|uniref:Uncharacterized protein n=1 Tax=Actinoplanes octamycinicus TaxID=135948 RepID=A0A7W7GW24_9ACTN|nr:hypothetical protein [Actinoplanes octamycinicus]GIE63513.1 hypothetical protein Aoc01nite_89150 [Actinoplanes octamycinicus]